MIVDTMTSEELYREIEKEGIRIVKTYISFEMLRDYQKPLVKQLISDAIVDLSLDFTRGDVNAEYRDYFLIKFYESQESLDLV